MFVKSNQVTIALFLITVFTLSWLLPLQFSYGFAEDLALPYITLIDSERVNVPSRSQRAYLEHDASTVNVPSNIGIHKVSGLKSAISSYKDAIISDMYDYQDELIYSSTVIEDYVDIIDNSNALISDYRNDSTIMRATSLNDLKSKINAASGSITIRITNLSTNQNQTFGNQNKSVTLIVDNLSVTSSNRSLTVYGNLIILNTLDLRNTVITTKKTSVQTDGNLFIDQPVDLINSSVNFDIDNMLYFANDFTFSSIADIQAGSIVSGGSLINSAYNSAIRAVNSIFAKSDFIINERALINCKDFIVNGDLRNAAYNTIFTVQNTFFVNNDLFIDDMTSIFANDFIVDGNVINIAYNTVIEASETAYIYNELLITGLIRFRAKHFIVDGSIENAAYNTEFDITEMLYVQNDFSITAKTNVSANNLFVGENLTNSAYGQIFDISGDIFFGSVTVTSLTTINSDNGDLIVEGMFTAGGIVVDVRGRIAIGGNITNTGGTFSMIAGGNTTSVMIPNVQEPAPTPTPTTTPPIKPIDDEEILIRQATITPDTIASRYQLTISYKRLTGIYEERIVIEEKEAPNRMIADILITPSDTDVVDEEGYVTYSDIVFTTIINNITIDLISIRITGRTQTSTYPGGNPSGYTDKPYFTTVEHERVRIQNKTATIYADHSANTIMPSSINKVGVKHLKKAIADYGRYFNRLVRDQIAEYEKAATVYNNRTIEQIEAIVAANPGQNIVIKTDNLNLTKNTVLGTSSKAVTLIVDNLTVNSQRSMEIYGNLIVKNNFNANQPVTIKTYKVSGSGGNLFTGNVNYNGYTTLSIANMLYAKKLTFNQGGMITADTIVTSAQLTINANTQIAAVKDIFVDGLLCNQAANISVTYGDLVLKNTLTINNTTSISVGGRVVVGKRIIFNQTVSIWAGGQKSALILPDETLPTEPVIVTEETYSKALIIDLKVGTDYTTEYNRIANLNNQQLYFAGDAIYYATELPDNAYDITLKFSLNVDNEISIYEPLSGNVYVRHMLSDGSMAALNTAVNGNRLEIESFGVDNVSSCVIQTKIKRNVTANKVMNIINNNVIISYKNPDGTNVSLKKNFTTNVVATPSLRMN